MPDTYPASQRKQQQQLSPIWFRSCPDERGQSCNRFGTPTRTHPQPFHQSTHPPNRHVIHRYSSTAAVLRTCSKQRVSTTHGSVLLNGEVQLSRQTTLIINLGRIRYVPRKPKKQQLSPRWFRSCPGKRGQSHNRYDTPTRTHP